MKCLLRIDYLIILWLVISQKKFKSHSMLNHVLKNRDNNKGTSLMQSPLRHVNVFVLTGSRVIVFFCFVLFSFILFYAILFYSILSYALLCSALLCCAMLCYAKLCYVMLCCSVLFYTILFCFSLFYSSSVKFSYVSLFITFLIRFFSSAWLY